VGRPAPFAEPGIAMDASLIGPFFPVFPLSLCAKAKGKARTFRRFFRGTPNPALAGVPL
jgi:hypothetical protein